MLLTIDEVKKLISSGKTLVLAGDEEIIKTLPKGNWIAGTIPYFMASDGGLSTKEKIFVNLIPDYVKKMNIKTYTVDTISNIYKDAPLNGFSIIILPASSEIHLSFALDAPMYEDFATRPLIGWISGMHLDDLGKITAKVFEGKEKNPLENQAVVLHASLPENRFASIGIVNIFNQGSGDTIEFIDDGFIHSEALINGQKENFAMYIMKNDLDIRLPLVADYLGVMVNVSFQKVDEEKKEVHFYAPVFKGQKYRQAEKVKNYVDEFVKHMPQEKENIVFSCNCILNYLYSELEGKKTGGIVGPITFGEVAYQLLNQTLAYLTIDEIQDDEEEILEQE